MSQPTKAQIFISMLAELRDAERERQAARLRSQSHSQACRFMKVFWAEVDDSLRLSEWRPQDQAGRLGTIRQSKGG